MYYYNCMYVLDYETVKVHRKFKTRTEAINYVFKKFPSTSTLLYEIVRNDKHNVEYVCDDFNRFWVSRNRY